MYSIIIQSRQEEKKTQNKRISIKRLFNCILQVFSYLQLDTKMEKRKLQFFSIIVNFYNYCNLKNATIKITNDRVRIVTVDVFREKWS